MVVDTSALMAVVNDEAAADACAQALKTVSPRFISAVTFAEALIVAGRRGETAAMARLLNALDAAVVEVTEARARAAAAAYGRWGRGVHSARLNFVDCFAYALARERGLPLLYVGEDFAQTDVASALPGAAPAPSD